MTKWLILTVLAIPAVAVAQTSRPTSRPAATTKPVALVALEQLKPGAVLTLDLKVKIAAVEILGPKSVLFKVYLNARMPLPPPAKNYEAYSEYLHLAGYDTTRFDDREARWKAKPIIVKVIGPERLPAGAPADRQTEYLRLEVVKP